MHTKVTTTFKILMNFVQYVVELSPRNTICCPVPLIGCPEPQCLPTYQESWMKTFLSYHQVSKLNCYFMVKKKWHLIKIPLYSKKLQNSLKNPKDLIPCKLHRKILVVLPNSHFFYYSYFFLFFSLFSLFFQITEVRCYSNTHKNLLATNKEYSLNGETSSPSINAYIPYLLSSFL